MNNETEIVRCTVLEERDASYLLLDRDNPERRDYFPKSQVSFQMRNVKTGVATAEIPLWLLKSRGWND